MKTVKTLYAAAAALLLAMSLAWAETDHVNVGVYASVSDAPIYIAREKGYFAEQNIEVDLIKVESGAAMASQLANGALDASGGAPGAGVYNAYRQGLQLRIVADKGSTPRGRGYFAFVVRSGLVDEIKTAADLRGRVLAVTGFNAGASSEVTINKLLAQEGVKESEVKLVNMRFGDILAGLGTGKVDVGVLIEPLVTLAEVKGVGKIWKRSDEIYENQQYGALMYGPGITDRPEVADRFMVAYVKGARFYNDALNGKVPFEELVDILTKSTSVTNADLYTKMALPGIDPDGGLNIEGMTNDVAWWHSTGRMREMVAVSDVADQSYARKAVEQLGPYQ